MIYTQTEKNLYEKNLKAFEEIRQSHDLVPLLCSFFIDRALCVTENDIKDEEVCLNSTTKGINGITTGILINAEFHKEKLLLTVFSEGKIHSGFADAGTVDRLLFVAKITDDDSVETTENNELSLDFAKEMPFVLKIVDGVISLLHPLDPALYKEAVFLAFKLFDMDDTEIRERFNNKSTNIHKSKQ